MESSDRQCLLCGSRLHGRPAEARYCGDACRERARELSLQLTKDGGRVGFRSHVGCLAAGPEIGGFAAP